MLRIWATSFVVGLSFLNASVSGQQKGAPPAAPVGDHAEHDHAAHGPHEGGLLEVGKEEFHVELIVDETKKQMVIYLLDKEVKTYVAIDTPFVAVNLMVNGKPAQVKLKPMPQETDQKGFSSCFAIASPELIDALHAPKADAKLALKIGKKAYSVPLVHNHDHAGHDHAGHDHAGHDHAKPAAAKPTKK